MQPSSWAANKANAQLSTGPTTDAGKQTVSQNALRHGLSGRVHAALPGEQEPFAQHCRAWREALRPVGTVEETLTQDIAADRWRLTRARTMENALFAQIEMAEDADPDPATADAQAWVDPSKGLQRIALYANRIQRAIEKDRAELKAMQAARNAAYGKAQEEAILLTQLAQLVVSLLELLHLLLGLLFRVTTRVFRGILRLVVQLLHLDLSTLDRLGHRGVGEGWYE